MSESTPNREWRFYLDDMIGFCRRVEDYTRGLAAAQWLADPMRMDATIRNLELIGEAATHVPDAVRMASTDVPWRKIIATRNRLVHAYLGIDNDTLWSIVVTDIPALLKALTALKAAKQDDGT